MCPVVLKIAWQRRMIAAPIPRNSGYYKRKKKNNRRGCRLYRFEKWAYPLFLPLYFVLPLHSLPPIRFAANQRVIANAICIWRFQEAFTIKVSVFFLIFRSTTPVYKNLLYTVFILSKARADRATCTRSSGFSFSCFSFFIIIFFIFFNADIYFTTHTSHALSGFISFFIFRQFHTNLFCVLFFCDIRSGREFYWKCTFNYESVLF